MPPENDALCPYHRHSKQLKAYGEYFVSQLGTLNELIQIIDKSGRPERLNNLGILLFSLISNGKSIINMINGGFVPEAYIIARAFLEKSVNFCYLNTCDESEYDNYLDWTYQKLVRAIYTKQKAYKNLGHEILIPDIDSLAKEKDKIKKFSGRKGGKKPNWTQVSLYHRIKFLEKHIGIKTLGMYLVAMNTIYEDASENIHGTLYGATFHTGILYGIKMDEESRIKRLLVMGFTLYMFLGYLIHGILQIVSIQLPTEEIIKKSNSNFDDKISKHHKSLKEKDDSG